MRSSIDIARNRLRDVSQALAEIDAGLDHSPSDQRLLTARRKLQTAYYHARRRVQRFRRRGGR